MESTTQTLVPESEKGSLFEESRLDEFRESEPNIWPGLLANAQLLWQERAFIARWVARATLLVLTVAILLPNRYESTVTLMPPQDQGGSLMSLIAGGGMDFGDSGGGASAISSGLGGLAGSLLGMQTPGALFVGVLGSRTVQDDLIDRFDLRRVYHRRYWEDARKDLAKNTEIQEDKKSGIISISVTDTSRDRAQKLAQAYAEELNARMSAVASSAARRERVFLEGRLKEEKQELDVSAQAFSQFASKNAAIDIKEQTTAMVDAAAQLEGQVIAAQSQLEGLQQIYSPDNYRVRTAKAQIAELQRQLQRLGGSASTQPQTTDQNQLYPPIRQLPLLGVEWANLYRRAKIAETVYLLLTREYELAKIEEAKEIPSVRVLDNAHFPERKSGPHRVVLSLSTFFLSLVVCCAFVIVHRHFIEMSPDDPSKLLLSRIGKDMFGDENAPIRLRFRRVLRFTS